MKYDPTQSLYARDPAKAIELVTVHGYRPCICEGAAKNAATLEEAASLEPAWARAYCLTHGHRTPLSHDLDRFPASRDSYSCDPCKNGDHVSCQEQVRFPDSSHYCACRFASAAGHTAVRRAAKRDELARVIYAAADGPRFWLPTVDGTPNQASYAIAEALLDGRHVR